MRNNHGEGRAQTAPRQESQEVVGAHPVLCHAMYHLLTLRHPLFTLLPSCFFLHASHFTRNTTAQCYNCHTTATTLWRKERGMHLPWTRVLYCLRAKCVVSGGQITRQTARASWLMSTKLQRSGTSDRPVERISHRFQIHRKIFAA